MLLTVSSPSTMKQPQLGCVWILHWKCGFSWTTHDLDWFLFQCCCVISWLFGESRCWRILLLLDPPHLVIVINSFRLDLHHRDSPDGLFWGIIYLHRHIPSAISTYIELHKYILCISSDWGSKFLPWEQATIWQKIGTKRSTKINNRKYYANGISRKDSPMITDYWVKIGTKWQFFKNGKDLRWIHELNSGVDGEP